MTEPKPRRFTATNYSNAAKDMTGWRQHELVAMLEQAAASEIIVQAKDDIALQLRSAEAQHTADLNRIDALMQQHAIYERTAAELRNELAWIYTNWPEVREAVSIGRSTAAASASPAGDRPADTQSR